MNEFDPTLHANSKVGFRPSSAEKLSSKALKDQVITDIAEKSIRATETSSKDLSKNNEITPIQDLSFLQDMFSDFSPEPSTFEENLFEDLDLLSSHMDMTLEEIYANVDAIFSHSDAIRAIQIPTFKNDGTILLKSSHEATTKELMQAANQPKVIVVGNRFLIDPKSGLKRGMTVSVVDIQGTSRELIVEFFRRDQLVKLESIYKVYLGMRLEAKGKNLKDHKQLSNAFLIQQLQPKKLKSKKKVDKNKNEKTENFGVLKKEIEKQREEEAATLKQKTKERERLDLEKKDFINKKTIEKDQRSHYE